MSIVETYKGHDITMVLCREHGHKYEVWIYLPIIGLTAHGVSSVDEAKKLIDQ